MTTNRVLFNTPHCAVVVIWLQDTRAKCPNYELTKNGTTLVVGGAFASAKGTSL